MYLDKPILINLICPLCLQICCISHFCNVFDQFPDSINFIKGRVNFTHGSVDKIYQRMGEYGI